MRIRVYTDGACSGNPGPGGWAAIFNTPWNFVPISGYETETTNNRMELTAVIESLKRIVDGTICIDGDDIDAVDIHSDSAYVVNAINNDWLTRWSNQGWKTKKGDPVKNQELWQSLRDVLLKAKKLGIKVSFVKVKGHAGNTFNEMVDTLAVSASNKAQAEIASWRC